ncbi:hypothetical protein [Nonlabens ponticola]|uniref:Uncharacterized protein n=1 Tax=Nonlabens ponticola TaxID=2496866 RepID=A0A3S9MZW5_9FLAO|nr:hypothetical protein [Nonlabens ponticola]AZQ44622.1 hypothetical protein EJ995_10360 [Nonlabens ponticola]
MSFLDRKSAQWSWDESTQNVMIEDNARYRLWAFIMIGVFSGVNMIRPLIDYVPSAMAVIITGIGVIAFLLSFLLFITNSVAREIKLETIEKAVYRKSSQGRSVNLKLSVIKYRQLAFDTDAQLADFTDFLRSKGIQVEEAGGKFTVPLNY